MPEIWIVEDNPDFRRATRRGLRLVDPAAEVREFGNVEDAVAAIDAGGAPDAVLMDIGLPGMDGIEGIGEVKRRSPATAVLVLTVFEDDEKIFRAITAGASGYCLKSDSIEEVAESVRQVLRGAGALDPKIAGRVLKMFSDMAPESRDDNVNYGLNDRERAVLEAMTRGLVRKQIAAQLGLNLHTLDYVTRCIYRKLHVNGATAAVALAIRERLVEPPPAGGGELD